MKNKYTVERDPSILNPELPNSGIGALALSAYEAFRDGRQGWDVTIGEPEHDVIPVTLFSNDDSMSIDDRKRWDAALRRFGLKGN